MKKSTVKTRTVSRFAIRGYLLPGLRLEDLQRGQARSKPRNPVLAMVLRDLPGGYMERAGTGVRFMLQQAAELGLPPPQIRKQGEFIVTFPKREAPSPRTAPVEIGVTPAHSPVRQEGEEVAGETPVLSDQERQALALRFVHEHGSFTNQLYRELTGVSERTALRDLEALVLRGALRTLSLPKRPTVLLRPDPCCSSGAAALPLRCKVPFRWGVTHGVELCYKALIRR